MKKQSLLLILLPLVFFSCKKDDSSDTIKKNTTVFLEPSIDKYKSNPTSPAYYIDFVNGNDDNDGKSPGKAWKNLDKIHNVKLVPGDIIRLARGSVWKNQCLLFADGDTGSEGAPITVEAYGTGEPPTIADSKTIWDKTKTISAIIFQPWGNKVCSYVTVLDLRIQDLKAVAIQMTSQTHHIVVAGCEMVRCGAGIGIAGQDQTVVSNHIHDGVMVNNTGDGASDWGANGVCVYGKNIEIAYNRFINCSAPSLAFGYDGGAIEFFGYQPPEQGTEGWNYVSENINIHHNIVNNCEGFMEAVGKLKNLKVAYNTIANKRHSAFVFHINTVTDGYFQATIQNNTFFALDADQWGPGYILQYIKEGTSLDQLSNNSLLVRNNIFASNSIITKWTNRIGDKLTQDHNLYYFIDKGDINSSNGGNWEINETEIIADPLFEDQNNLDFRLKQNSPAINAGILPIYDTDLAGNHSPSGESVDIGAYEF